jgi:inhibitor of cysteine peptidase
MTGKREGIILVAGVAIGIIIAVGLLVGLQILSPGTGTLPLPDLSGNGDGMPQNEGIRQVSTIEEVREFIASHTETGTETGTGIVAIQVPVTTPDRTISGGRSWQYNVDTAGFRPDEYIVKVTAITHDVTATALFNILSSPEGGVIPMQGTPGFQYPQTGEGEFFIMINPVGDHYVGERFAITGTTNLPAGDDEMLIEVVSSSFAPTAKTQTGEFSGATGTFHAGGGGSAGGSFSAPIATHVPTVVPTYAVTAPISYYEEAGREYSRTNVQVKDVEEADIVKTDGTFIYVVSGNALHMVRAYPAESAEIVSTTGFSGTPISLYLYRDRVALICRDYRPPEYWRCEPGEHVGSPGYSEKTVIYIFSVEDPSTPNLEREIVIDGMYTDSRMIGEWLYFLTSNPVDPESSDIAFPEIRDGEKGTFTPVAYSIEGRDKAFAFTTIGSVSLGSDAAVNARTFLVGTAGTVYASPTHLYIGILSMTDEPVLRHVDAEGRVVGGSASEQTNIYSFSLKDGTIRFAAAGEVDGVLLNQYAMDEYEGYLRLATTMTRSGSRGSEISNAVTVLDDNLDKLGTVTGIAPDERIYATRFMGDRLYMVTFRETDPFFVIDLSDPSDPVLAGMLKLPGYSDYLHPYDSSHIIGVGKTASWGAVKLSLFDVSDIENPGLVDSVELGEAGSNSAVLDDPKAFLFDKEKDILVLPLHLTGLYDESSKGGYSILRRNVWGGAYVFSVDPDQGFSLKGKVKHYDEHSGDQAQVKRALYIEDTLYTISARAIYMSDLGDDVRYVNDVRLG